MSLENQVQKLQKILNSKTAIKNAISNAGGTITNLTPLEQYSTKITEVCIDKDSILASVIDKSIVNIDIPQGVTQIGVSLFYMCKNLTSITLPNSLINIGEYAFTQCEKLKSIIIPNSVTSIGNNVFYNCFKLESCTLPNSLTTIGTGFFQYCYNLENITIPQTVTSIGQNAFHSCRTIQQLVIPNSVTTIISGAFRSMNALKNIVFGTGVETIGNDEFAGKTINLDFTLQILATTPPTLGTGFLPNNFNGKIYVPDASVNDYKVATNWSTWVDYIYPLSEYHE